MTSNNESESTSNAPNQVSQGPYDPLDNNEHTQFIFGRPNFWCGRIANILRLNGTEINHKAEDEQATVIRFLLGFYVKYGGDWKEKCNEAIQKMNVDYEQSDKNAA